MNLCFQIYELYILRDSDLPSHRKPLYAASYGSNEFMFPDLLTLHITLELTAIKKDRNYDIN